MTYRDLAGVTAGSRLGDTVTPAAFTAPWLCSRAWEVLAARCQWLCKVARLKSHRRDTSRVASGESQAAAVTRYLQGGMSNPRRDTAQPSVNIALEFVPQTPRPSGHSFSLPLETLPACCSLPEQLGQVLMGRCCTSPTSSHPVPAGKIGIPPGCDAPPWKN